MSQHTQKPISILLLCIYIALLAWTAASNIIDHHEHWNATELTSNSVPSISNSPTPAADAQSEHACNHGCHLTSHLIGLVESDTFYTEALIKRARFFRPELFSFIDFTPPGQFRPPAA